MIVWTVGKLIEFKNHFGLHDKDIAKAIGETPNMIWKIRNFVVDIDRFVPRINGYFESLRDVKIAEHKKMIKYYEDFK